MELVDIKRIQERLLNMAMEISNILNKHEIPHMIAFGTLLGAIRHKGFIPWDDDFDFYLFDDSYDIAIEYLRNNLSTDLFLEDVKSEPLYFHSWAHVKDTKSKAYCVTFPQDNFYAHNGLCIDLYRTKRMMLSELEVFLYKENIDYILRRNERGLISQQEFENRIKNAGEKPKHEKLQNDYEVFTLVPFYKCHRMKAIDVFPLKKYAFENFEFWGPNNGEHILTDIYGEYMKLPREEDRRCHYSNVKFINS